MLNKFLLIGVGGSGGKTLRFTWRELERRLGATDWTGGIPRAWQFLHIDIPAQPDVATGSVPVDVGTALRYVNLASQSRDYDFFDTTLVNRGPLEAIAGWRPNPRLREIKPPFKGAGQLRAVGRVITVAEIARVGTAVQTAASALFAEGVDEELALLNRTIGATAVTNNQPSVVVFASLAGGSGSGGFIDIVELLKSLDTDVGSWLSTELMTVLYTADAFPDLPKERRAGIEPNSLAALAEFLNGYEHTGDLDAFEEQLVAPGGGVGDRVGRRTGSTNFFVGNRNDKLEFDSGNDIYQAIGKAFAAFIANDEVQQDFHTYGFNATPAPIMSDFAVTTATGICRSIGYSNVSLGRSLFERYAGERLAKRAVERLLRGHLEVPRERMARPEILIKRWIEELRDSFFEAAQLWEIGGDHNQVLDALRSQMRKAASLDKLRDEQLGELRATTRKTRIAEWLGTLNTNFEVEAQKFVRRETEERIANAKAWVPQVEASLLDATADFVGHHGLLVTIGLLDALNLQLIQAAEQLEQAETAFQDEHGTILKKARNAFNRPGGSEKDKIATSHPGFQAFAQLRRDALQRVTEATLYGYAARLLRDLAESLVAPLRDALEGAKNTLVQGEEDVTSRSKMEQWSTTVVPAHLRAAPNEVLLDKEDEFPQQFEALLADMFPGEGAGGAEKRVLAELIRGGWPSTETADTDVHGPQALFRSSEHWRPKESTARDATRSPAAAQVEIDLSPDAVRELTRQWVKRRQGHVSQHVHMTLAQWLADPQHAAERASTFASAFEIAHASSAPLVKVNANVHLAVHGEALPAPTPVIGKIPIGANHAAHGPITTYLRSAGLPDAQIKALFDANSAAQEVEISSFLGWAVHPVVLESVVVPIQQEWNRVKRSTASADFWALRRARPLPSFVPLQPEMQDALVRGWYTAGALGHLGDLSAAWSGLSVWTPRGPRSFPAFLLGPPPQKRIAALPALLESYALALVSFGTGDAGELEAYMRLIELGGGARHARAELGEFAPAVELNPELRRWLESGEPSTRESSDETAPLPDPTIAGAPDDTAEQRRAAVLAWVNERGEVHHAQVSKLKLSKETTLTLPRGWEIRLLVADATRRLADAIAAARLGDQAEAAGIKALDELGA